MTARPPEAGSTGPATSAGNGGCAQQQDASTGVLSQGSKYRNYETVFTNSKAGMTGVDREHVKKVVYEMSKDSAHFINEQRKQAQVDLRIHKLLQRAKGLTAQELAAYTRAQDMKLAALEATRDLSRVWIHVDMDAFYAAVEERDDPSLASKPMAVGGVGMITTANYLARKFGVRSAMPGFIARKLCPELVFVRPDFAKYKAASDQTRAIFCEYDPEFEAGSMDEAYLDVTDYCHAHGITGRAVAQEVRIRVHQETRLTCSAGIAPNTMIAKVCSDINKPNGQFEVPADADAVRKFVEPLPIRKVSGIGKVAEQTLKALGVELCSQLIEKRGLLAALFSQISSDFFMAVGLGLGRTLHHEPVKEGEVGRRGMSVERTFRAISSKADLEAKCAELAHKLAEELADGGGLKGKTITLKLKTTKFELRTRAITLPVHVSSAEDILAPALRLLRVELPLELRLMGIRMSNFKEVRTPPGQKSIADFVRKEAVPAQRSEQDADAAPSEQPPAASSHHEADLQLNGGPAADGCPLELSLRDWGTAGEAVHTQGPASQHIELSLEDWQHARDDPLPADAVGM
ncbi:hypothetical protein WJX72_005623 [[Myrmecia] bisecta]|uniref:DNA polymerase kappa n=1 Tax=[Myrmecia] bisecta TaxID=41462 RepID=A0AAW1QFF1_9CHLO